MNLCKDVYFVGGNMSLVFKVESIDWLIVGCNVSGDWIVFILLLELLLF